MNTRNVAILTFAVAIIAVITGSTVSTLSDMNAVAQADAKKSCAAKKFSNCKGDKGWYIKGTHHHCFKSEKNCVKGSGNSYKH